MSLKVTDEWTAFGKAFKKEMVIMQGKPYVKVGFPAGDAFEKEEGNGITVGMVAIFAEFGTWSEPERSFLRATFDEKQREIKEFIAQLMYKISGLEITTEQALNQLGAFGVKLVVQKIDSQIPPPNAPSTIARKGSSTPLIDSGQMRQTLLSQGWKVNIPK